MRFQVRNILVRLFGSGVTTDIGQAKEPGIGDTRYWKAMLEAPNS